MDILSECVRVQCLVWRDLHACEELIIIAVIVDRIITYGHLILCLFFFRVAYWCVGCVLVLVSECWGEVVALSGVLFCVIGESDVRFMRRL